MRNEPAPPAVPAPPAAPSIATPLGIAPGDDRAAVEAWLAEYGNPLTQRVYRLAAKRVLLWATLAGRPIAALSRQDWVRFSEILADRGRAEALARHIRDEALRARFHAAFLRSPRGRAASADGGEARAARTLTIVRVLLGWLRDHGHVSAIPLPKQRGTARPREDVMRERVAQRLLTPAQFATVLDTLRDLSWATREDARMLFVLTWLSRSGVRRQELAHATTADFVMQAGGEQVGPLLFWVVRGKGNRRREVPVTPGMVAAWDRYRLAFGRPGALPTPPGTPAEPLVLPLRGTDAAAAGGRPSTSGGTIWLIVRRFGALAAARAATPADAARIRAVSPHWYRHQLATLLLDAGRDIRDAQALLGHAAVTTTSVYQHVRDTRLASMMVSLEQDVLAAPSQPSA